MVSMVHCHFLINNCRHYIFDNEKVWASEKVCAIEKKLNLWILTLIFFFFTKLELINNYKLKFFFLYLHQIEIKVLLIVKYGVHTFVKLKQVLLCIPTNINKYYKSNDSLS